MRAPLSLPVESCGGVMWMRATSSLDTQSSLCSYISQLPVLRAAWRLQTLGPPSNSRLQTVCVPSKTCRLHTQTKTCRLHTLSSLLTNAYEVQASGKRFVHASMEKEALVWGTSIVVKAGIAA